MANYNLTNRAVQDLKQIWNYTLDKWSERQADKYYNDLVNHCSRLANKPTLGKQYEYLIIGLRGSKVNKHIIFYRQINQGQIEIARILHERMDIESRILEK